MNLLRESLVTLFKGLVDQKPEAIYGVRCCDRVYIGKRPALKCRTCPKTPTNVDLKEESDIDKLIGT